MSSTCTVLKCAPLVQQLGSSDGIRGPLLIILTSRFLLPAFDFSEEIGRKCLHLFLTEPVTFDGLEGSRVIIKFSSSLDIARATEKVYGHTKKRFSVRKTSVVKTPVHVNFNSHGGSQVFIPESQVSLSVHVEGKESSVKHYIENSTPDPSKNSSAQQ
ncbi:hypothetical protein DNTS_008539, partial [Danionella cerebrum]